jgi:hypothetical protein
MIIGLTGCGETAKSDRSAADPNSGRFARQFVLDLTRGDADAVRREIAVEARLPPEYVSDSVNFWRKSRFAVRVLASHRSGESSYRVGFVATRTPRSGYLETQKGVITVDVGTSHGALAVTMFNTTTRHIQLSPTKPQ